MGEYAQESLTGRRIKLGTCESLYYVTRGDLEFLAQKGWRGDGDCRLSEYLDTKAFRTLLPFGIDTPIGDPDTIEKRQWEGGPKYAIRLDEAARPMVAEAEHQDMCFNKGGVNFFVPCPLSAKEGKVRTSHGGAPLRIELFAEGMGVKRACYRCPYCDSAFNFREHPTQGLIASAFRDQWNDKTAMRFDYLCDLVEAGMTALV